MEPLHVVDKLNAISVKLPAIGIDQSRFVTKRENTRDGGRLMIEQQNDICRMTAMLNTCEIKPLLVKKAIRTENVFKLE